MSEEYIPWVLGFIVFVIYSFGHYRGAKSERKKQDELLKSLTIKKLSEEQK
ncbi:hypothetical protein [Aeromonas veronii]|uniref:hypothetical protein n=1 Tax=Aeromonas TaxID=642 RepID=UPI0015D0A661|nr:hypothetical protein [Aeromonas veronii]QLH66492.1 hypothetical protein HXV88_08505 [Aeromonas veronii]